MRTENKKRGELPPSKAELRMAIRLREVGLKAMRKSGGDPSAATFKQLEQCKKDAWIAVVRHIQKWKARR